MANRRVLVKRRKAVRNIRKITRTMQLIATARFQAAYNRAVAGKPYTEKLAAMVRDLARAAHGIDHPLMRRNEDSTHADVLVVTSTRGLCGGYNANVLRTAIEHLDGLTEQGVTHDLRVAGKKGITYMGFVGRSMTERLPDIGDTPRFEQVEPLANAMMERFIAGEIGAAYVAYMKFISTGKQAAVVEQLLPLSRDEPVTSTAEEHPAAVELQYEFSPEPRELLDELLPATVRVRLYQCFTDAAVSEQVARMVAMKAATDAAEDMIKRLTQQYNRARQTAITMELLDIVGGANALS